MAGAAGSSSTGSQGGNGYVVSKTVRLHKGDVLSFSLGSKGGRIVSGTTSRGGGKSTLRGAEINWIAGGGTGAVPSYNDTAKTVTSCSMAIIGGGDGGSSGSISYHTCDQNKPGACYSQVRHSHSHVTCASHQCGSSDNSCGHGTHAGSGLEGNDGHGYCHHTYWDCSKQWDYPKTCGKNDGTILSQSAATPGSCSGDFTSQSLSNAGGGYFSIKLADHYNTAYSNTTIRLPYYLNDKCNLIVLDDTVVYYKR